MATSVYDASREDAAAICRDIAVRMPAAVPLEIVNRLAQDGTESVRRLAKEALTLAASVTEEDRTRAYSPFSMF